MVTTNHGRTRQRLAESPYPVAARRVRARVSGSRVADRSAIHRAGGEPERSLGGAHHLRIAFHGRGRTIGREWAHRILLAAGLASFTAGILIVIVGHMA